MNWSEHKLVPYGFDALESCIVEAQRLLPDYEQNFVVHMVQKVEALSNTSLPEEFDFVYWHVWDNWLFTCEEEWGTLSKIWQLVAGNGRLILGFYASQENNLKRVERLRNQRWEPDGLLAEDGLPEVYIWYNRRGDLK